MDETNKNVSLPEAKDSEDEKNLPSTSTTTMKSDDLPALGNTEISLTKDLQSADESGVEPTTQQQTPDGDSSAISDSQRNQDNKTPEELIEEVQDEVKKWHISDQQVVADKTNESLKSVLAYNSSDSNDSLVDITGGQEIVTTATVHGTDPHQSQLLATAENNKNLRQNKDAESSSSCSSSDSETDSFSADSEAPDEAELENTKAKIKLTPKHMEKAVTDSSDSESDSACSLSSDSDSDEDDSDAELDCVSVVDNEDENINEPKNKSTNKGAVKKTNITGFEEADCFPIPDISNLNINDEVEFMHIGSITHIVAEIATVTVIPGTPAFDLDSMLFIEYENVKKPMGPIFDVIGPVSNPIYCVRFNSEEDIKKLELKSGTKVFAAPKSEEFTKFVFLSELLKMKYSDASHRNDTEVPTDMAEFSDDEKEREARRKRVGGKRKINDNSLERHKKYEQNMNKSNTMHTKLCKMNDIRRNNIGGRPRVRNNDGAPVVGTQSNYSPIPMGFDPTVPPPGFASQPMSYQYPVGVYQQPSMFYQYFNPSMQNNVAHPYVSQLDFANEFAPPARDFRTQPSATVNNYMYQHLVNNNRNKKRGPGPSSQPY